MDEGGGEGGGWPAVCWGWKRKEEARISMQRGGGVCRRMTSVRNPATAPSWAGKAERGGTVAGGGGEGAGGGGRGGGEGGGWWEGVLRRDLYDAEMEDGLGITGLFYFLLFLFQRFFLVY
jgi:hypothetical protein